jgi:hypothetical protein
MFPAMHDRVGSFSILAPVFNPLMDRYLVGAGEGIRGADGLPRRGIPRERAVPSSRPRREWPSIDQPDHERRRP